MTLVRPLILALALSAAAAPASSQPRPAAPAAQAPAELVPLRRVFPYLDRFYGVPAAERSLFRLRYRFTSNERPFTGRVWYVDPSGARTPVALASGEPTRLPTADMLRGDRWRMQIDAPRGTQLGVGFSVAPTLRPSTELRAADLTATITQVNSALRRAAGIAGFAVPRMARVAFEGARAGEVVLADGSTRPLPTFRGEASFEPAAFPQARSIRFATAPSGMYVARAARDPARR